MQLSISRPDGLAGEAAHMGTGRAGRLHRDPRPRRQRGGSRLHLPCVSSNRVQACLKQVQALSCRLHGFGPRRGPFHLGKPSYSQVVEQEADADRREWVSPGQQPSVLTAGGPTSRPEPGAPVARAEQDSCPHTCQKRVSRRELAGLQWWFSKCGLALAEAASPGTLPAVTSQVPRETQAPLPPPGEL